MCIYRQLALVPWSPLGVVLWLLAPTLDPFLEWAILELEEQKSSKVMCKRVVRILFGQWLELVWYEYIVVGMYK